MCLSIKYGFNLVVELWFMNRCLIKELFYMVSYKSVSISNEMFYTKITVLFTIPIVTFSLLYKLLFMK